VKPWESKVLRDRSGGMLLGRRVFWREECVGRGSRGDSSMDFFFERVGLNECAWSTSSFGGMLGFATAHAFLVFSNLDLT
jgi:hypothetical protein